MAMLRLDYQQNRSPSWAGLALLVLTLAALALTAAYYLELSGRAASWEDRRDQTERRQGTAPPGQAGAREAENIAVEVKRANEVLRQLTLPWDELFKGVESAAGKEIALLAMEPNMEKHVVKISGEARDLVALLDYIMKLEEQGMFGPVYLQSHQVQQQDPERPVRFSLLAAWREKP